MPLNEIHPGKKLFQEFPIFLPTLGTAAWLQKIKLRKSTKGSCKRVILENSYKTYRQSLKEPGMDTLERRREILCLRFAKKCLKNEKLKNFSL